MFSQGYEIVPMPRVAFLQGCESIPMGPVVLSQGYDDVYLLMGRFSHTNTVAPMRWVASSLAGKVVLIIPGSSPQTYEDVCTCLAGVSANTQKYTRYRQK